MLMFEGQFSPSLAGMLLLVSTFDSKILGPYLDAQGTS